MGEQVLRDPPKLRVLCRWRFPFQRAAPALLGSHGKEADSWEEGLLAGRGGPRMEGRGGLGPTGYSADATDTLSLTSAVGTQVLVLQIFVKLHGFMHFSVCFILQRKKS